MTWGTHCPMCGRVGCEWADGDICEGLVAPEIVTRRESRRRGQDITIRWFVKAFLMYLAVAIGSGVLFWGGVFVWSLVMR